MLAKFLEKLGQDTELLEAYKKDPKGVMQKHGLSDDEVKAVMSGDVKGIQSLTNSTQSMGILYVYQGKDDQ